jgi:hypothetical protein
MVQNRVEYVSCCCWARTLFYYDFLVFWPQAIIFTAKKLSQKGVNSNNAKSGKHYRFNSTLTFAIFLILFSLMDTGKQAAILDSMKHNLAHMISFQNKWNSREWGKFM